MKKTLRVHISEYEYDNYIDLCNKLELSLYDWIRDIMHKEHKKELSRMNKNEYRRE